ncbi:MAG TPA: hypothetical protein EYG94_07430 [Campylobacterales bacterium]|nr:hypothetical protein [Campylobacterales bacterium]
MKNLKTFIYLSSISFVMLGCSSHNEVMHLNNVVHVSEVHLYNDNYGLDESEPHEESLTINLETLTDLSSEVNSEWTTELTKDPDAFYAHEYVQKEEIITYKYEFDTKFYDHAEWRSAEF